MTTFFVCSPFKDYFNLLIYGFNTRKVEMHVVRYSQLFATNEKRQHDTTVAFQTPHKTTPYNEREKIGKMRNPDHHPLSLYVTYQVFWQCTCVYVNIYSTKEKRT